MAGIARVYEFGLLDPTMNANLVDDQMRAAHRYRNLLVEIERSRRDAVRGALSAHPAVEPLEAEVQSLSKDREALRDQIRRANAAVRGRADTKELREKVRVVAGALRGARAKLKAAKGAIVSDAGVVAAITAANEAAAARVRQERARCGVYWSTYLLQEADADRARKEKMPPKFRRWDGEGRVSVQLQGGLPLEELWGGGTQIRIDPVDPLAHDPTARCGDRRRAARTLLRLRVQSDERGRPIWATWPMILHRPLPEGCRIKVATVHCRRRDCWQWEWRLRLQVELPEHWTEGRCGTGAVALNLGYAQSYEHLHGGVRAGYLIGEDGAGREIAVAASVSDRVEKSASICSIRDKNLDEMRASLVTWLRAHEAELPAWLVERTILSRERPTPRSSAPPAEPAIPRPRNWHIALWRSAARFRALAFAWRETRFSGDEAGYDLLENWRYRDEHLQNYQTGMHRGALLDRREQYRIAAVALAARYDTLVVGSTDLRELQRSPRPEEERTEIGSAKRAQRLAAGSILRSTLENAFKRRGGKVVVIDDHRATTTCHACGSLEEWDRIAAREHTCDACGARWDQDENYCKNLLARHRREQEVAAADAGGVSSAKGLEKKESRSERLRRTRWKPKEGGAARDV